MKRLWYQLTKQHVASYRYERMKADYEGIRVFYSHLPDWDSIDPEFKAKHMASYGDICRYFALLRTDPDRCKAIPSIAPPLHFAA